jgi:quinoprotein glucose dehydrogenase
MIRLIFVWPLCCSAFYLFLATAGAQEPDLPSIRHSGPLTEAALGMKSIRLPAGMQISLFAAEPMLANPVCFCIDEHNRFYVAETYRIHHGVEDTREHMYWLDDDLAAQTVADRVALFKKYLPDKWQSYGVEEERIRLIQDRSGRGKADHSEVFAGGFRDVADGIGAGLLARGDKVWYACIPNLWLLRDSKRSGKADGRTLLHTGYGVHVSFYGHDLHGLKLGPDGKLYFSIGDRGFNVTTENRKLFYPHTGAVLRCNPDGTDLEVVATGLRNPQELAFDQYGNLFTGDNNADHGDQARWVYVVEGGDSGWRIGFQYLTWPVDLGPWQLEHLWKPHWEGQAAYIVPPIANVADGPAGLVYYPGTGLAERYREHFFLCDFRGSSGMSGIRSFAVKPHGASFDFVDQHQFIWSVLATDVDFGTDGAMYVLDWIDGWSGTNKGRIYRVWDPERINDPAARSVKKLLANGMAGHSNEELARLLEHADMRVRQEAQFALVERGGGAVPILTRQALSSRKQLARLHAIWGLGQLGRKSPAVLEPVLHLLADPDAEVRCQAAKVCGDDRLAKSYDRLVKLLEDPLERVRFFAAQSLGKLGKPQAMPGTLQMLRANADRDVYLRHAGVVALARLGYLNALRAAADDPSAAARMSVLLAWRRLENPEISLFLHDQDPALVLEAARAIYDVPIAAAFPDLAALARGNDLREPLLFRALNANFRLGNRDNAGAVAGVAARSDAPARMRTEALQELANWYRPSGRDRVTGLWRPLPARSAEPARAALAPHLADLLHASDSLAGETARTIAALGLRSAGPRLLELLADKHRSASLRTEALKALESFNDGFVEQAMKLALEDRDPSLHSEGTRLLAKYEPRAAAKELEASLEHGSIAEMRAALEILGSMSGEQADTLIERWLDKLLVNQVAPALQLDLLEAAGRRSAASVRKKLATYERSRSGSDPMARYREALEGGNAEAGREIFLHKDEVQCVRCHKMHGQGGEVGPDLTGIGSRQKREYLLESIVDPNRQIAKGFETTVVGLTDGKFYTGIVKSEDDRSLRLMTPEGKLLDIPKQQIEERQRGKSAMPEDILKFLSKSDLRNLVEFLASQK